MDPHREGEWKNEKTDRSSAGADVGAGAGRPRKRGGRGYWHHRRSRRSDLYSRQRRSEGCRDGFKGTARAEHQGARRRGRAGQCAAGRPMHCFHRCGARGEERAHDGAAARRAGGHGRKDRLRRGHRDRRCDGRKGELYPCCRQRRHHARRRLDGEDGRPLLCDALQPHDGAGTLLLAGARLRRVLGQRLPHGVPARRGDLRGEGGQPSHHSQRLSGRKCEAL